MGVSFPGGGESPTFPFVRLAGAGLCLLISNFRFGMAEMSEPLSAQVEEGHHLLAPQLPTQNHLLGGVPPMKLEKIFVHAKSAYPYHGRSPLFEIRNDLILAQSMPSGPSAPTPIADVRRCFARGVICDGFSDRVFQAVNKQCLMIQWMSANVCGPQAWLGPREA